MEKGSSSEFHESGGLYLASEHEGGGGGGMHMGRPSSIMNEDDYVYALEIRPDDDYRKVASNVTRIREFDDLGLSSPPPPNKGNRRESLIHANTASNSNSNRGGGIVDSLNRYRTVGVSYISSIFSSPGSPGESESHLSLSPSPVPFSSSSSSSSANKYSNSSKKGRTNRKATTTAVSGGGRDGRGRGDDDDDDDDGNNSNSNSTDEEDPNSNNPGLGSGLSFDVNNMHLTADDVPADFIPTNTFMSRMGMLKQQKAWVEKARRRSSMSYMAKYNISDKAVHDKFLIYLFNGVHVRRHQGYHFSEMICVSSKDGGKQMVWDKAIPRDLMNQRRRDGVHVDGTTNAVYAATQDSNGCNYCIQFCSCGDDLLAGNTYSAAKGNGRKTVNMISEGDEHNYAGKDRPTYNIGFQRSGNFLDFDIIAVHAAC